MRIFVAPLVTGELTVRGDEHHYLSRVRRARAGDRVELVDGEGLRATAEILAVGPDETRLAVGAVQPAPAARPEIRALIPAIKGDRMDVCIEKLVEAGADAIVVWPAARAVVKLDGTRRESRLEHYRGIAQAAARQSGRATVPTVEWAESLAAALKETGPVLSAAPDHGTVPFSGIVLDPGCDERALPALDRDGVLVVASGPEGGLTPAELETLIGAGFSPLGLGPRVLRAETAPVIAVALVRAATQS
jgi:16S rRNA (uracil1498-N3)-methyltransferase